MLLKTWQQPQGRLASNEDHFTKVQRFALEIAGEKYCYSLAEPSLLPGQGRGKGKEFQSVQKEMRADLHAVQLQKCSEFCFV